MGVHGDYPDRILHKDDLDSILNRNIEESFKSTMQFLKENGISTDKKPKLKIIESPYIGIYELIKSYISDEPIPSILDIVLTFRMMWKYRKIWGLYAKPLETVYIIKNPLKRIISGLLNTLHRHRIITKEYSIWSIRTPEYNYIRIPVYIDWNDIENTAAKILVDIVMGHELSHAFISEDESVASASGYLICFYKNKLYKYPEADKIIKENIKQCKEYIEKEEKPNPYDLRGCLTSIII